MYDDREKQDQFKATEELTSKLVAQTNKMFEKQTQPEPTKITDEASKIVAETMKMYEKNPISQEQKKEVYSSRIQAELDKWQSSMTTTSTSQKPTKSIDQSMSDFFKKPKTVIPEPLKPE